MVNFKNRKLQQNQINELDPIAIYDKLDRKSIAGPLRPIQKEILEKWRDNLAEKQDLIIKLHTGEGKTLIGLLISYANLNRLNAPSIYICPSKFLVSQVCYEAEKFGIPYCTIEENNDLPEPFLNSTKILITHVQKVFNGRSIFKLDANGVRVGSIILDDSHACIEAIQKAFTIVIKKEHEVYSKIFDLFSNDLQEQGMGSFLELKTGDSDVVLPVPYWSIFEKADELTHLLSDFSRDNEIFFSWPLFKDVIPKCSIYFSANQLEITIANSKVSRFQTYQEAKQRILMSATTQEDTFFLKGLNFSLSAVENPITSNVNKWSGEKMIVFPGLIDDSLDRYKTIQLFTKEGKKSFGVCALVPSLVKAEDYYLNGATVATSKNIDSLLSDFKKGNFNKTLVLVNRYDGIDLPDEICRVLILDSLPRPMSHNDWYEVNCRPTSDITNLKIAQKIEQGLGRSVRGEKDYTIIIIIGNDLVKFIKSSNTNKYFSDQTKMQINIGKEIVEMAQDELTNENPISIINKLITQLVRRDNDWKDYYQEKMNEISKTPARIGVSKSILIEKQCEDYFYNDEFKKACEKLQKFIDEGIIDDYELGWYLQSLAKYMYNINKLEAIRLQKKAFTLNRQLLKPEGGINYDKITNIDGLRIKRIKDYLNIFNEKNEFLLHINSILSDLSFDIDAEKFEHALFEVGKLLGFQSQRPDKSFRTGPDNLWAGGDNKYFIFECKNQVKDTRVEINKNEAGQMNNHCGWIIREYGEINFVPIMIIQTLKLSKDASFTHNVKVMRKAKLKALKKAIQMFINEICAYDLTNLQDDIIELSLKSNKLNPNNIEHEYTEDFKQMY